MQLRKAIENGMFPYFLATFQWVFLVFSLAFNLNFSVTVTGAVANGGLKVIMLFHLWIVSFPIVLCLMFFRIREKGIAEKCIIGLSVMNASFSAVSISLHFVDNFVLLMKATEVVAWSLYNSLSFMSVYKISIVFFLPLLRRLEKIDEETPRNYEKL